MLRLLEFDLGRRSEGAFPKTKKTKILTLEEPLARYV